MAKGNHYWSNGKIRPLGRRYYALKLRNEGWNLKDISVYFGLSLERVRHLIIQAQSIQSKHPLVYNTRDVYADFLEEIKKEGPGVAPGPES